jgi:dienelactone hydrolase
VAVPLANALRDGCGHAVAQTPSTPGSAPLPPLNRFPRMMQDWLIDEVRAAEARGNAMRDAVKTRADAEMYVKSAQARIREAFGPLPERTPLNARVARIVEREGYRIECVVFESRPGYLVTGNLYLPVGRKLPAPAVIGVCGHSSNGKAADAYQAFAQNLARLGYVCFIFDPVGQGERLQFIGADLKSRVGPGVAEHIQMGNQQPLVGEFLGTWFVWDAIRALDYLLTRKEVDPQHIGVTGNSGGGTQTTWLCGMEPRFTMAAPACFVTTIRRDAENELPQDTEQCPPGVLALGLDHSDFLAAMAPKPVVILAQEKDYFDARGATETYERLKRLYALLGKPENIQLFIGPDYHGYSQANREAMYRFFNKVTGVSDVGKEPAQTVEKDEVLWCAPRGQVAELKSRTLMSFTRETAKTLASKRTDTRGDGLKKSLRAVLKMPALPASPPDYRILRTAGTRRYPAKSYCTYAVETEPRIHALVTRLAAEPLMSRLPVTDSPAILYVSHRSADAELRDEPLVRELMSASPDAALYACDVRGIGDSQPDTCGENQFLRPYGSHYFYAAYGLMLDRPLAGQRTFDLLRVIQLLAAAGHREVHLAARGWGTIPAAFAAVLSGKVTRVTLKNAPTSFGDIVENEAYQWPYAAMLPHVLKHFDLPDCYAELQSKGLRSIEPWGAADGMK